MGNEPGPSPFPSPTLIEIANLATEISRIRGNEEEHTEDFLLAIKCHPRAIARNVIEEIADDDAFFTKFTARVVGVGPLDLSKLRSALIKKWDGPKPWTHERLRKEPPSASPLPPLNFSSYNFRGPTRESNWLIPGRVMCGEVPGGWDGTDSSSDLDQILAR